jgi:hypothetical protein
MNVSRIPPDDRRMPRGVRIAVAIALTTVLLALGCGPIGPFSGGRLSGDEGRWPSDWNEMAEVAQIQLESGPDDPHSVNLWFAVLEHEPFVATSLLSGVDDPEDREWVRNIADDARVRVRIEGFVYAAELEHVDDPELARRVFRVFLEKYPHLDESRGEVARYFRIVKRADSPGPSS